MPDIVVDMNRGDGGDSNQSCWGFVLPRFLFLGSHSIRGLTSSAKESKGGTLKTKTLIIPTYLNAHTCSREIHTFTQLISSTVVDIILRASR